MWDHAFFPYKVVTLPITKSYLKRFKNYSVICWERAKTSDCRITDANDPNTRLVDRDRFGGTKLFTIHNVPRRKTSYFTISPH